ncbi:hypothetical protein VNO77_39321 [Canavalia gladiata]|uniref:Uncharacterized protein n=1 Tax=Canavalia gladiata TaxID=3824 RepID=A0AAN9KCX2_CANGL
MVIIHFTVKMVPKPSISAKLGRVKKAQQCRISRLVLQSTLTKARLAGADVVYQSIKAITRVWAILDSKNQFPFHYAISMEGSARPSISAPYSRLFDGLMLEFSGKPHDSGPLFLNLISSPRFCWPS